MGDPLPKIASNIEGAAPEPSSAVESQDARGEGSAPTTPAPRDRDGKLFDSRLHETTPDGGPRLTRGGQLWRKGGRARQKALRDTEPGPTLPPTPGAAQESAAADVNFRTTARVTVVMLTSPVAMLAGEHWKPAPAELETMVSAWTEYYKVRGIQDLPPEFVIAATMGAWAAGTDKRRADLHTAYQKVRERIARARKRKNGGGQDDSAASAGVHVPEAVPHS